MEIYGKYFRYLSFSIFDLRYDETTGIPQLFIFFEELVIARDTVCCIRALCLPHVVGGFHEQPVQRVARLHNLQHRILQFQL